MGGSAGSAPAARTGRHIKGMLTGPVTILAWSFVRTDQALSDTADQVALALRDECHDLEATGLRVIQVDEPALRETLPLRRADQAVSRSTFGVSVIDRRRGLR
ncbi:hypothetical protein ACNTMW_32715 [Planosporangium sp. 12N6]|uniref:hypothetical protein n=1 Tax=Planosporangium spinosum TaxID=3402278 RepID=UPI003CEC9C78